MNTLNSDFLKRWWLENILHITLSSYPSAVPRQSNTVPTLSLWPFPITQILEIPPLSSRKFSLIPHLLSSSPVFQFFPPEDRWFLFPLQQPFTYLEEYCFICQSWSVWTKPSDQRCCIVLQFKTSLHIFPTGVFLIPLLAVLPLSELSPSYPRSLMERPWQGCSCFTAFCILLFKLYAAFGFFFTFSIFEQTKYLWKDNTDKIIGACVSWVNTGRNTCISKKKKKLSFELRRFSCWDTSVSKQEVGALKESENNWGCVWEHSCIAAHFPTEVRFFFQKHAGRYSGAF